ncbi:MAG: sialate O-acetylesterase, partial [Bacteroidaceae bacterium]|nr:sialate O-acetylesterase [Bacteroidaceae bacterium]
MKKIFVTLCCLFMTAAMQAKVILPDQIGDYMVLQQQTDAKLWGWATAGTTVQIKASWTADTVTATANEQGKWVAFIKTPAASYVPQTLTISDGDPVTLQNVLIGEVWFASGQSNMQMPLIGFGNCPIEGSTQAIATAGQYKGKIRFATLDQAEHYTPQERVGGEWKECTPDNARRFGATAFFFAENLQKVLDVPIGIINSAWGGSRVEGW